MSCWATSDRTRHVTKALRLLALAVTLAAGNGALAQSAPPVETRVRVYPLEVLLNGAPVGIWPIVERNGEAFAPPEAFEAWRVQRSGQGQPLEYKGLTYFPVSSLPGANVHVDVVQSTLRLDVAAEAFAGIRTQRQQAASVAQDAVVPSVFLNYDVNYNHSHFRDADGNRSLGMLGELGYSTTLGLLTNSFAVRDLVTSLPETRAKLLRLETTMRRDLPEQGLTLNLGDATSRSGYLGRPTLFGGIQIGSNFGLAPQVNRQPLPVIMGQTLAPSTVQLYVNDVLRQTARVPAGQFTIDSLPAIVGNGDVSVVVRDILGRETVITQPFFISADLLAPGLNDWSLEAGRLREDLGSSSSHYGSPFASGMWRRGLTPTVTAESRAEVSRTRSTLGLAGVAALGGSYLARAGLAGSSDEQLGQGARWSVGLDWRGKANSVLVNAAGSSRVFRYLAEPASAVPSRLEVAAQAGFFLGPYGRLGAGLAMQFPYGTQRISTASLTYTTVLRDNWQLNVGVSRVVGLSSATGFSISVNIPLSKRSAALVSAQSRGGRLDAYSSFSRSPEGAYGTAWRVLGGYQGEPRGEASIYHFGTSGIASGDVSATREGTHLRLGAVGGLLYTSGKVYAMPRHDSSAALVHVPGYKGVGVGLGQQVSTRTDSDGYALVPRLNAYQSNPIRLDPNARPSTPEIDRSERPAGPAGRGVARVVFPVRGGRAAVIRVVLEDGQPAPSGATVRIAQEPRDFYVGRRGEAYVTGLQARNRLRLSWKGASCALDVDLPEGSVDEVARVGPVTCQGAIQR